MRAAAALFAQKCPRLRTRFGHSFSAVPRRRSAFFLCSSSASARTQQQSINFPPECRDTKHTLPSGAEQHINGKKTVSVGRIKAALEINRDVCAGWLRAPAAGVFITARAARATKFALGAPRSTTSTVYRARPGVAGTLRVPGLLLRETGRIVWILLDGCRLKSSAMNYVLMLRLASTEPIHTSVEISPRGFIESQLYCAIKWIFKEQTKVV